VREKRSAAGDKEDIAGAARFLRGAAADLFPPCTVNGEGKKKSGQGRLDILFSFF
jgi:hypothetical protein